MPEIKSVASAYMLLLLVVPGLVTVYVRTQFITGRMQKHSDASLSYFALSAVYGAIAFPLLEWLLEEAQSGSIGLWSWFGYLFVGPALLGAVLGLLVRTEALRKFIQFCKLNPVHSVPTAWDWKFGNMNDQLVIVTLKDDTKFAGYCGKHSFMSSDPVERDLYVEKIYGWGVDDSWVDNGEHGLWVAPGEIRSIEFFPVSNEGS